MIIQGSQIRDWFNSLPSDYEFCNFKFLTECFFDDYCKKNNIDGYISIMCVMANDFNSILVEFHQEAVDTLHLIHRSFYYVNLKFNLVRMMKKQWLLEDEEFMSLMNKL